MGESYEVYFGRMVLTLGLIDRETLQRALVAHQRSGTTTGFPKHLVEQGILDRLSVSRAVTELEAWFATDRQKAAGIEPDPPAPPPAPAPAPAPAAPPPKKKSPASQRVFSPSDVGDTPRSSKRPPSSEGKVPSPSGRVRPPSDVGANVKESPPAPVRDKQWAMFNQATKDPLARLV